MSRARPSSPRGAVPPPAAARVAPILATVVALLLGSCGGKSGAADPADTLSTRARREAIGRSGLRGATGINRALEVADSATTREAALDSLIRSR
jgi:hypothetical protein